MPSYFFYLKLELYPAAAINKQSVTKNTDSRFVPAPGTNIFGSSLPAHQTSQWSLPAKAHAPAYLPLNGQGEVLLLPDRSSNLREPTQEHQASPPTKRTNDAAARDWRYDVVTIQSIDMEATATASRTSGQAKTGLHTKAVYVPSNPKTTEVGYGIVHLYRDTEQTPFPSEDARNGTKAGDFDPDQCTTLCILAVPSWMMPSDMLGFVGDQAREDVSHFRLIRTERANKYMVLMKFRSAKRAKEWQKANNGRLFSAAEPENCHVVFIKNVEFLNSDTSDMADAEGERFPNNNHDPFIPASAKADSRHVSKSLSSKPLAPPPPNLLELPTCPVCLERMDETTGLLTILCQHVFHCSCLEKWRGSGCPVCRYTHSPSYTFPYPRPHDEHEEDVEPMCSVCAGPNNLWICLICGNVGCGRYESAHAKAHYEDTSHCYAMDMNTQRVWDYAGDGYVHRLIQAKPSSTQGQGAIDLPSGRSEWHENEAFRAESADSVPREKMESMATEYTFLLTSQLSGQRKYFEEQVERAVDKAIQASARAEEAAGQAEKASAALAKNQRAQLELKKTLEKFEKDLEKEKRARQKFEKMARDMSHQLREEKTMNDGLSSRIKAAEKEAEEAKQAKTELEDMNHDLTMFISSQEKVKELQAAGEDVVDGTASVPEENKRKGKERRRGGVS